MAWTHQLKALLRACYATGLNVQGTRGKLSEPDLTLVGHTDNAEFALGMANPEPLVASGGKDTKVSIDVCGKCLFRDLLVRGRLLDIRTGIAAGHAMLLSQDGCDHAVIACQ